MIFSHTVGRVALSPSSGPSFLWWGFLLLRVPAVVRLFSPERGEPALHFHPHIHTPAARSRPLYSTYTWPHLAPKNKPLRFQAGQFVVISWLIWIMFSFPFLESVITDSVVLRVLSTVYLHPLQPTRTQNEFWNHWGETENLQSSLLVAPFLTIAHVLCALVCLHSSATIIGRWAWGLFLRYLRNTDVLHLSAKLLDAAETMG